MSQLKKMFAILVASAAFGVSAPAFAAPSHATTTEVVSSGSATARATATAPSTESTDAARYAQLEQKNQQVQKFEGGSTVVIAMSGGAFVVALLLVILLL